MEGRAENVHDFSVILFVRFLKPHPCKTNSLIEFHICQLRLISQVFSHVILFLEWRPYYYKDQLYINKYK